MCDGLFMSSAKQGLEAWKKIREGEEREWIMLSWLKYEILESTSK